MKSYVFITVIECPVLCSILTVHCSMYWSLMYWSAWLIYAHIRACIFYVLSLVKPTKMSWNCPKIYCKFGPEISLVVPETPESAVCCRPEMVVGWYHSHPGFGCWLSGVDINTQQSFEALSERAVAVVVDPIQSVKGKVSEQSCICCMHSVMQLEQSAVVPEHNVRTSTWMACILFWMASD